MCCPLMIEIYYKLHFPGHIFPVTFLCFSEDLLFFSPYSLDDISSI